MGEFIKGDWIERGRKLQEIQETAKDRNTKNAALGLDKYGNPVKDGYSDVVNQSNLTTAQANMSKASVDFQRQHVIEQDVNRAYQEIQRINEELGATKSQQSRKDLAENISNYERTGQSKWLSKLKDNPQNKEILDGLGIAGIFTVDKDNDVEMQKIIEEDLKENFPEGYDANDPKIREYTDNLRRSHVKFVGKDGDTDFVSIDDVSNFLGISGDVSDSLELSGKEPYSKTASTLREELTNKQKDFLDTRSVYKSALTSTNSTKTLTGEAPVADAYSLAEADASAQVSINAAKQKPPEPTYRENVVNDFGKDAYSIFNIAEEDLKDKTIRDKYNIIEEKSGEVLRGSKQVSFEDLDKLERNYASLLQNDKVDEKVLPEMSSSASFGKSFSENIIAYFNTSGVKENIEKGKKEAAKVALKKAVASSLISEEDSKNVYNAKYFENPKNVDAFTTMISGDKFGGAGDTNIALGAMRDSLIKFGKENFGTVNRTIKNTAKNLGIGNISDDAILRTTFSLLNQLQGRDVSGANLNKNEIKTFDIILYTGGTGSSDALIAATHLNSFVNYVNNDVAKKVGDTVALATFGKSVVSSNLAIEAFKNIKNPKKTGEPVSNTADVQKEFSSVGVSEKSDTSAEEVVPQEAGSEVVNSLWGSKKVE